MMRVRSFQALSVAVAVILPAVAWGQMIRRSAPPQRMGGEIRVPTVRRGSSQPPIRMGSLPQYSNPMIIYENYSYGGYPYGGYPYGGYPYGGGRPYTACSYGSYCSGYTSNIVGNTFSFVHVHSTYVGRPWVVAYAAPVYTKVWSPGPAKIWSPTTGAPAAPAIAPAAPQPFAASADSGGRVMRIESASDSVVRVTWAGTTSPIREARLFLADSVQQSLRAALVDQETRSALFKVADLAPRIAYVGLTITHANGMIETMLLPFTPGPAPKR